MKPTILAILLVILQFGVTAAAESGDDPIAKAVGHPQRSDSDRERDETSKPESAPRHPKIDRDRFIGQVHQSLKPEDSMTR